MNVEMLLRALFKFMGVDPEKMRDVFDKGQSLIVDGHQKINTIDERLARIEAKLGISPTTDELVAIESKSHGMET